MTYAIYKAGIPQVSGISTGINTYPSVSAPIAAANYISTPVSAVAGTPVKQGPNSNNGTTVAGQKMAGSLNVNGTLTIAPGRNSPQS